MPPTFSPATDLNALRVLKGLKLAVVARRAKIPVSTASQLLNGRLIHAGRLQQLRRVIEGAPGPRMTVHR